MKAEKKPHVLVEQDIVLTLTPEEAQALFYIVADFVEEDRDVYFVKGSTERFDVTLHEELLALGVKS